MQFPYFGMSYKQVKSHQDLYKPENAHVLRFLNVHATKPLEQIDFQEILEFLKNCS